MNFRTVSAALPQIAINTTFLEPALMEFYLPRSFHPYLPYQKMLLHAHSSILSDL